MPIRDLVRDIIQDECWHSLDSLLRKGNVPTKVKGIFQSLREVCSSGQAPEVWLKHVDDRIYVFLSLSPFNANGNDDLEKCYDSMYKEIRFQLSALKENLILIFWFGNQDIEQHQINGDVLNKKGAAQSPADPRKPKVSISEIEDIREDEAANITALYAQYSNPPRAIPQANDSHIALQYLLARDDYTFEHSVRSEKYAINLASFLREKMAEMQVPFVLSFSDAETIGRSGKFHDLGKIYCPDYLLRKLSPLKPYELYQINRHAPVGLGLIASAKGGEADTVLIPVVCHHLPKDLTRKLINEHFDASNGSKTNQLRCLIVTAILKICDSLDSMLTRGKEQGKKAIAQIDFLIQETTNSRNENSKKENWRLHWELPLLHEIDDALPGSDDIASQVELGTRRWICEWLLDIRNGNRCEDVINAFDLSSQCKEADMQPVFLGVPGGGIEGGAQPSSES